MSRTHLNRWFAYVGLPIIVIGCTTKDAPVSKAPSGKPLTKSAPADPWILTCLDPQDSTPALLWNGNVGLRVARDSSGKGQSLFSIYSYETNGEEKIKPLKSPLPAGFVIDGKPVSIEGNYKQTLNMKTSQLDTSWDGIQGGVSCTTILSPDGFTLAQRWIFTPKGATKSVAFDLGTGDLLDKPGKTTKQINLGSPSFDVNLSSSRFDQAATTVVVVISGGSAFTKASKAESLAHSSSFDEISKLATNTWAKRWQTDIEIEGPVEDQQAIHSFLYYLRSSISPEAKMAISPFGLSNQMYNGHVFWDADTWVFPSLALIDPAAAKSIPDYRISKVEAAKANAQKAGAPAPATKFPWESSISGKETVPGPSQKELHISGDVAWMFHQAANLGLVSPSNANEVMSGTARYFASVAKLEPKDGQLTIPDVMSPDENHVGDNDLYTNLLAQWVTNGGSWTPNKGGTQFHLPKDGKTFLTYDNDPLRSYKQAAAVLSIYPLQFPGAESQAKQMMERFASKVIKNGPAMSDSVHATIWARLGDKDKAYQCWKDSWEPFSNQPLLLFSEKRTKPTTYFSTGAAGSLQTVLFGFLGFRLDSKQEPDAVWSKQLQGNLRLSVKANFPRQWKSVKVRNFTVLGHKYTLTATHRPSGPDAAQVIQGD